MIIFSLIYIIGITYALYGGIQIYQKNKNAFGKTFLLFSIFLALWMLGYYIFGSGITNVNILAIDSKLCFTLGIYVTYSLLFSIYFLKKGIKNIPKGFVIFIITFFLLVGYFFIFTNNIIDSVYYIEEEGIFREKYGNYILINVILQILFVILFIIINSIKTKSDSRIINQRMKYIGYSSYVLIIIVLMLQAILPIFNIWLLEDYIIFLYIIYIFSIILILKRFYYTNIGYGIGKIIIFISSISISNFFIYIIDKSEGIKELGYMGTIENSPYLKEIIIIVIFLISYNYLNSVFLGYIYKNDLRLDLENLEFKLANVMELLKINNFLQNEIPKIIKTNYSKIIKINNKIKGHIELKNIFENKGFEIVINDQIYFEENNINYEKIEKHINSKAYLIFPLYDIKNKIYGFYSIGNKKYGEFYNKYEIDSIKKFSFFLQNHLKYIENYQKLEKLTLSLDKEVDKKTIEYNNLINKQKEYIGIVSHELKSPISSAIFQADYLLEEAKIQNNKEMIEEVSLLNEVLVRIGELTSKLFNSEYFEKDNVSLYKEKVNISNLLEKEFNYYKNLNPNINFINKIQKNQSYYMIDKVQFKQVIQNIISNSIKFINKKDGIIAISMNKNQNIIEILIEDNGIGLEGVNTKEIFDRYSTSKDKNVGLGMGLFLCKRIIELHGGKISAQTSKKYGGAKFKIKLNIKNLG